ncbi:MAG: hypothetical protein JST11_31075 [Acidobacteria bacterium]|nr:hypothetical protein [Acidobacteriota bacterium]
MKHVWLALAAFCAGVAGAAGPSYTASGIVNASNYAPGPFAPGSVISIFGSDLARSSQAATAADIHNLELNYVRVYANAEPVPVLFVSEHQINFVMSTMVNPGPVIVRVATEGQSGPEIQVTVVNSAPSLFSVAGGYALATDAFNKLLSADSRAHPGDTVVVYLTGLGRTSPNTDPREIPQYQAQVVSPVKVTLGGVPVDAPLYLKYVGLTPTWTGLYQINLVVPGGVGTDPELKIEGDVTASGLKLPIR